MEPTINIFRGADNRQDIPAGTVLFAQGDQGGPMFALVEGRLSVKVNGVEVDQVEPGGVVGEMALIDPSQARAASVTALEDSVVVPLDESEFLRHVHSTPFFALQVIRVFASRLRRTNELIG